MAGQVEGVRVVRDRATSVGKGFAFVLFKTQAAARSALSLNGEKFNGRPLRVTRASKDAAAAAAGGGRGAGRGAGRGGGRGGRGGGRGAVARASDPSSWQGLQTKGKGKAVKEGREGRVERGGGGDDAVPANRVRKDKRPAVAARKEQQAREAQREVRPEGLLRRGP